MEINTYKREQRNVSTHQQRAVGSGTAVTRSALDDDWLEWEASKLRPAISRPNVTAKSIRADLLRLETALQTNSSFLLDQATSAAIAICCTLLPLSYAGILSVHCAEYVSAFQKQAFVRQALSSVTGGLSDDVAITKSVLDVWRAKCDAPNVATCVSPRDMAAGITPQDERSAALAKRLAVIAERVGRLELLTAPCIDGDIEGLRQRQDVIDARTSAVEIAFGLSPVCEAAGQATPMSHPRTITGAPHTLTPQFCIELSNIQGTWISFLTGII